MVDVLRAAEGYLEERGVDAPRRSAELLMGRELGMSRLELYLAHDRPVTESERVALRKVIAARGRHVPVAYLLGDWDFHGLTLAVTPDVLIPRPETEGLVDLAIERAPSDARCVEIGTGSGAIAIALAVAREDLRIVATDVSDAAAKVAKANVDRHGLSDRVEIRVGSFWDPIAPDETFDLLVSNPPYVDPNRPDLLADDVREHEPSLALFASPDDVASSYRALVNGAEHLAVGAPILFETGIEAAESALELLRSASGIADAELRNDLADLPRYLLARRA